MTSKELDFEELLKQYDYNFQKGDLVKGIVCGYDSQGVMVDIGAKTIAVVPTREAVDRDENIEAKFEKGKEYEFSDSSKICNGCCFSFKNHFASG